MGENIRQSGKDRQYMFFIFSSGFIGVLEKGSLKVLRMKMNSRGGRLP